MAQDDESSARKASQPDGAAESGGDLLELVDQVEQLVRASRRLPLVARIVVDKAAVLDLLDQIRVILPTDLERARRLLAQSEAVLAKAKAEAARLVWQAEQSAAERQQHELLAEVGARVAQIEERALRRAAETEACADQHAAEVLRWLQAQLTELAQVLDRARVEPPASQASAPRNRLHPNRPQDRPIWGGRDSAARPVHRTGRSPMGELIAKSNLTDRMLRAARLETSLYNEVEADRSATSQALTVVVVTALAGGIGAALGQALAGRPTGIVGGLIGGVIAELLGWLVWSYVMYLVGTRVFHGRATYGELLRTLGFANSPGVLLILRFIPLLGGLIALIVALWRIVAGFIAVREALDLDNGNTVATIVVGIIGYLVVLAAVGLVLAAVGLSVSVLTGGPA